MGREAPRLLLVLPQLPQDPASGAARSMTSICELLAECGWQVRALCTTLSESKTLTDARGVLEGLGIQVEHRRRRGAELRYQHRAIVYRALPVAGHLGLEDWQRVHGRAFDLALSEELSAFRPDIMFTYGMYEGDVRRHRMAVRAGVRIVFGLRNEAYLGFREWGRVSGVLTPSRYLSDLYRADTGLESTALHAPFAPAEIVAPAHDPIFMTFVNPSVMKGVDLFAHIAERLSVRRPDLPFLVIESGGSAGTLVAAGLRGGFDLRRHENIMISPPVPLPRDIFAPTRVLLVPSLREAGARVVAEALLNGVPPIVSDRGGLPEMCNGAGRVLPVDEDRDVERWIEAILPLMDDEALYQEESAKARAAATVYDRDVLRPQYDAFFRAVLAGTTET